MSGYQAQAVDAVEPVSDSVWEMASNAILYNVIMGCVLGYDGTDMTVDITAGVIVHFRNPVTVAAASNVVTLVSDPDGSRFTWIVVNGSGTVSIISGDPSISDNPTVPELGDYTPLALLKIQAGQTVANNITNKIDKRIPNPDGFIGANLAAATTTSTSATDLLTVTCDVPIGLWCEVTFDYRKDASAAQAAGFGLKINSTTVVEAQVAAGYPRTSATQRAEAGFAKFLIPPRESANYGFGCVWDYNCFTTAGAFAATFSNDINASLSLPAMAAAVPNAAITSITIRAINATSNNNAEVRNLRVRVF